MNALLFLSVDMRQGRKIGQIRRHEKEKKHLTLKYSLILLLTKSKETSFTTNDKAKIA